MKNSIPVILVIISLLIGACAERNKEPEKINNSERNKSSIIKANEELFNKGNLSFADEVFTSNYAGEGPELIKKFVGNIRTAFPDTYEKKAGALMFIVTECALTDQHREPVCDLRSVMVIRNG